MALFPISRLASALSWSGRTVRVSPCGSYICGHAGVWLATGGEIVEHYVKACVADRH